MLNLLAQGAVIPAHPLALDAKRQFDRRRQRALTRYYVDAGAGDALAGRPVEQVRRGLPDDVTELRGAGLHGRALPGR
mgnify:CR=1 FL=1